MADGSPRRIRAREVNAYAPNGDHMKTYTDSTGHIWGVSFPVYARPHLQMNHIDGPLLTFRDGQMHWLTWWERYRVWRGMDDAESIERRRRPNLMKSIKSR